MKTFWKLLTTLLDLLGRFITRIADRVEYLFLATEIGFLELLLAGFALCWALPLSLSSDYLQNSPRLYALLTLAPNVVWVLLFYIGFVIHLICALCGDSYRSYRSRLYWRIFRVFASLTACFIWLEISILLAQDTWTIGVGYGTISFIVSVGNAWRLSRLIAVDREAEALRQKSVEVDSESLLMLPPPRPQTQN